MCVCECVCLHVCAALHDYHSQGNVICDLEEMELSLADLLMALSIHSAFPQLLQQGEKKKNPQCSI